MTETSTEPGVRATPRYVIPATLLAWLLLCTPLLLVSPPPLLDLPNHLARIFMITAGQEDAYLDKFYAIEWRLIPYLAMDLVMTPIALATGVYRAANILIALSFLIWLTAAMLIHRALHGTYSYLPLFAGLFLYNGVVNLGFINYFFSTGLALLAFAGWMLWRGRPAWFLFLFLLLVSWVVFIGHLVAFGVLCLLVGSYEMGRYWRTPRSEQNPPAWRSILLWLLPLSLPFIWLAVSAPPGHGNLDIYFGDLRDKIGAMISPTHMLSAYGRAGVIVFGAAIVMLYLGVRWRRIAFARDLKLTLLLWLCTLFATPSVLFGVEFVDLRLPFIFWLLLACSIVYRPTSRREGRIVAAVLAVLVIVRVGIVAHDWSRLDADYKELFRAGAVIPEGSRVLATCDCATNQNWRLKLHVHSTALLVIERKIFSPTLFTGLPILKVRPPYDRISAGHALPPSFADLALLRADERGELNRSIPDNYKFLIRWHEKFDVLVALFPDPAAKPPAGLDTLHEGSFFTIYRNPRAGPDWP